MANAGAGRASETTQIAPIRVDVLAEIKRHFSANPTSLAPFAPTRVEQAIIDYLIDESERRAAWEKARA